MGCGTSKSPNFRHLDAKGVTEMKTNSPEALALFAKSLQLKQAHSEKNKESIGKSYLVISFVHFSYLKDNSMAISHAVHAIQHLESFSKKNLVLLYGILCLANIESNIYEASKANLEKCLTLSKEIFNPDHEDSEIPLFVKASFEKKIGKYAEALKTYLEVYQFLENKPKVSKDEALFNKVKDKKSLSEEGDPLDLGVTLLELSFKPDISEVALAIAECYFFLKEWDNGYGYLQKQLLFTREIYSGDSMYKIRVKQVSERTKKLKSVFSETGQKIDEMVDEWSKEAMSVYQESPSIRK